MKTRYKIIIIVVIVIFSIIFIPPNTASFSCNTLQIKDVHCHVVGMTFFGIPFPTSIYHWFEWDDPIRCGGIIALPELIYTCEGFGDFWGYPAIISKYSDPEYHQRIDSLNTLYHSSIPIIEMNIDEYSEVLMIHMTKKNANNHAQAIDDLVSVPYEIVTPSVNTFDD